MHVDIILSYTKLIDELIQMRKLFYIYASLYEMRKILAIDILIQIGREMYKNTLLISHIPIDINYFKFCFQCLLGNHSEPQVLLRETQPYPSKDTYDEKQILKKNGL